MWAVGAVDSRAGGGVQPPRKLYKIGEVMEFSGISRQTLHNYTIWGLISEAERTPSGHRLYGEEVFDRLRRIEDLKKQKHTLKEIRRILEGGGEM
jgi:DNA-binding transcriptional MerR regulator